MYKASVVDNDQGLVTLEITVSEDEVRRALGSAVRRLGQRYTVPGFRKGKAPRLILENYVGREIIYDEAIRDFVPKAYEAALEETNLIPLEDPAFEGLDDADLDSGEPLTFKARMTVKPEVKLGDYKSIKLDREKREVTEADIDRVLENLRDQRGEFVSTERTTAQAGDLVTVSIEAMVDGERLEEISVDDTQVPVGMGYLMEGIDEEIEGMTVGEPKSVTAVLPEGFYIEELAGHDVTFNIIVKDIKVKQLPELDDEFAKDFGETKTLEELRNDIKHSMMHHFLDEAKKDLGERALDALVTTSEVEPPKLLVEQEAYIAFDKLQETVEKEGLEWEEYLEAKGQSEDDVYQEMLELAPASVKKALVIEALAKEENLFPTTDEVSIAVAQVMSYAGAQSREILQKAIEDPEMRRVTTKALMREKVLAYLANTCDADPESAICQECAAREAEEAKENAEKAQAESGTESRDEGIEQTSEADEPGSDEEMDGEAVAEETSSPEP
ncbi:MAG TPA: trigger factor [Bacillota bacterium]|jgi:trigger factor|nr:trigger factor [Bacillota bacterium]HOB41843.1 trigger factor [Bacillota bacterium]HOK70013.1 trigger factor [Bacillota bacterium]HOL51377.1 trigger factor [Bacillota bacterium]HOO29685.1 trigger factor [Bacillota bacterium]